MGRKRLEDYIVKEIDYDDVYRQYENTKDFRLLYFYAYEQCRMYREEKGMDVKYMICYDVNKIIFYTEPGLQEIMQALYFYDEKAELEKQGFLTEKKGKKIFISYSHKDWEIVETIYHKMQLLGVNLWIDVVSIDVGDNKAQDMLNGLECECAVFFLSENYRDSLIAKSELRNFLNEIFRKRKKWYLIKLDSVCVDEIQAGLSHYKYYDYFENSDADQMVVDIKRVLLM